MYKSLPINLILASQEKTQLLILATEHGVHSLFGSRDELVLAKERSYASVGKKTYSTRQIGGRSDPAVPTLTTNQQPGSLSSHIYRPLFPLKHSRPEEQERRQKTCLFKAEGWWVYFSERLFQKNSILSIILRWGKGFIFIKIFNNEMWQKYKIKLTRILFFWAF